MTLKGYAKFKGKLTCGLKNDLRNLVNFHASSQKSGNLHFYRLFLSKAYKGLDEKVLTSCGVMPHNTEECPKFEEKLTLGSKNDMKNLVNFNVSSGKSVSFHFDLLLFSITYKVSAKKVQKNYLSWY